VFEGPGKRRSTLFLLLFRRPAVSSSTSSTTTQLTSPEKLSLFFDPPEIFSTGYTIPFCQANCFMTATILTFKFAIFKENLHFKHENIIYTKDTILQHIESVFLNSSFFFCLRIWVKVFELVNKIKV
jgi:hypothetical protein